MMSVTRATTGNTSTTECVRIFYQFTVRCLSINEWSFGCLRPAKIFYRNFHAEGYYEWDFDQTRTEYKSQDSMTVLSTFVCLFSLVARVVVKERVMSTNIGTLSEFKSPLWPTENISCSEISQILSGEYRQCFRTVYECLGAHSVP